MRCWGCRRPRTGGWRVHRRISTSAADGKSGSELGPAASGSRRQFDPTGLPRSDARSRHRRRQRIQQRPQPGCTPVRPCLEVHAPQWIQSPKAASPSGPASPGSSLTSECESKVPTDISVTGRAPTGRGAARAPRSPRVDDGERLPPSSSCLSTYLPCPCGRWMVPSRAHTCPSTDLVGSVGSEGVTAGQKPFFTSHHGGKCGGKCGGKWG